MPDKKQSPVTTPLHLLRDLSESLLAHLEEACADALFDAEKVLTKLEKQRGKVQDKLHKQRDKLQAAALAGKAKAQAKARQSMEELEEALDTLKARQSETREFIAQLRRDTEEALKLAQGVGKVKQAAAKAVDARGAAVPAEAAPPAVDEQKTKPAPARAQTRARSGTRAKPAATATTETAGTVKRVAKKTVAADSPLGAKAAPRKAPARPRAAGATEVEVSSAGPGSAGDDASGKS